MIKNKIGTIVVVSALLLSAIAMSAFVTASEDNNSTEDDERIMPLSGTPFMYNLSRQTPDTELNGVSVTYALLAPNIGTFWVQEEGVGWKEVNATLKSTGTHCYVYVDNNSIYNKWDMVKNAFENDIYAKEVPLFGNPPNIDGDDKIYILISELGTGVGGYFMPDDQDPGKPHSNAKDIIYLDDDNSDQNMKGTAAHEFNHLIHWEQDAQHDEELWVLEGTAMYAEFYVYGTHHWTVWGDVLSPGFEGLPDISLTFTTYAGTRDEMVSQYGAAYLFTLYLHEKYGGASTIGDIVKDDANGIAGINHHLTGVQFKDVFETWTIANYVDDNTQSNLYWYENINLQASTADRTYPDDINKLNPVIKNTLNEWAADYVEVEISSDVKSGDAEVGFQGEGCLGGLTHSDYIVKLILFDTAHPNGLVLDFVDDHENDEIIPNINEYDKVVAVIGCKDHCFGGDGGYTFTFESSLYLDVVLDTDRSGSMSGQKMTDAKNAAKTFIDLLEEPSGWWIFATDQDKVGLVSFASSATLDRHLTSDFNDAKSVIDGYSASGMTNMGDALSKSINEITTNGRDGTTHTIIYLTDGMTNTGSTQDEILNTLVPQAVDAGISIYTLGYGSNVDSAFLSQVASTGNGKYYFAPDGAALQQIYIELSHIMKGWQPVASFSGAVSQGETKAVGTLNVQPKTSLIKVVLSWPGSDLDLILIDPNGNQAMPGAGVIYSGNDALPEYYEVYDPEPGDWTIQIYGKDVTDTTEDYNVMVFQPGALMQVNPTNWNVNYPLNRRMTFNVSEIAGNVNLTNVTFTASNLTEAIVTSTTTSLMKSQAEAEERGEVPIATLTKDVYAQNMNIIPADCFSFTPNDFSVPAGESKNVEATLTLPSNSIPSGTYSGTINVSSDGGNSTIFVTVTVASVESATGTGTSYFASDAGTIEDLTALNEGDLPKENPNVDFPHGLFSFNITGLTTGPTVNLTIAFPSNIPPTVSYWKYGPNGSVNNPQPERWYNIPIGSNDGDDIITIQLTDGGTGDDDGITNGKIVEPGGPGIQFPIGNVTGGGWIVSPIISPKKNNKATFGFVAHYVNGSTIPTGNIQYNDFIAKLKVHGNVTTLNVDKETNTSIFSGIAKITNSTGTIIGTYTVTVIDNGEPGNNDIFNITLSTGYTTEDTLGKGNIQIHEP